MRWPRRVPMLAIAVLSHGALIWMLLIQVRHTHDTQAPAAAQAVTQAVTQLRFYRARPPVKPAAAVQPSVANAVRAAAPAIAVSLLPVAQESAPQAPSAAIAAPLDIDAMKRLVRGDAGNDGHTRQGAGQAALTAPDLAAQAIARAARPQCDNDYTPQIGAVKFTGLMKLPFLANGALSDAGCKW